MVDALFHEPDQQLLQAFRERMEKMDRRVQLARICGIEDQQLLDRLLEMKIPPEAVGAPAELKRAFA